ncbi:hypothetical protein [Haloferula sp.]|uniref:hypothetical protein n=1 Tax=Haloferula sp. TaxID=2497595 RepID=UPI003C7356E8
MNYQLLQADDPSQFGILLGDPGGPVPVTSMTKGSGGPLVFDVPFLAPLFRSDGSRKEKSFLMVFITPRIVQE